MKPKNLILAVVISGLVLIGWHYLFPPPAPKPATEQNQTVQNQSGPVVNASAADPSALPEAQVQLPEASKVEVSTPLYRAELSSAGAVLTEFDLKNYRATIQPNSPQMNLISDSSRPFGVMGLLLNGAATWRDLKWTFDGPASIALDKGQTETLVFRTEIEGLTLARHLKFSGDTYLIEETIHLSGLSAQQAAHVRLGVSMSAPPMGHEEDNEYDVTKVTYYTVNGLTEHKRNEELEQGIAPQVAGLLWGGVDSNYFLLGVAPATTDVVLRARFENDIFRVALEKTGLQLAADGTASYQFSYYVGPKEREALLKAPNQMIEAINYGYFSVIAKPLMWALKFFYGFVGNYGLAIIILTVCIRILFLPLSQKSYKSMNQLKKLQPLMKKIKEQYKDDRRKMNEEMMNLYKTYKVNPAGGCLPMLVQIPVFIGLYQGLLHSIELRHAALISYLPFTDMVWLADLSAKDPYYITPIIMGISMFIQQKMTPAPGDPTQAKIMLLMPVIFTFLFLGFPAGLVVYWLVSNVLGIAQQWWMLRNSDKTDLVPATGPDKATPKEAKIVKNDKAAPKEAKVVKNDKTAEKGKKGKK